MNCGIEKCKKMFELYEPNCQCRLESLMTCRKACGKGMMVKPGTCRCVKKPKCSIKKCKDGCNFERKLCECLMKK